MSDRGIEFLVVACVMVCVIARHHLFRCCAYMRSVTGRPARLVLCCISALSQSYLSCIIHLKYIIGDHSTQINKTRFTLLFFKFIVILIIISVICSTYFNWPESELLSSVFGGLSVALYPCIYQWVFALLRLILNRTRVFVHKVSLHLRGSFFIPCVNLRPVTSRPTCCDPCFFCKYLLFRSTDFIIGITSIANFLFLPIIILMLLTQASSSNSEKKIVFPATDCRLSNVVANKFASSLGSASTNVVSAGPSDLSIGATIVNNVKPSPGPKTTRNQRKAIFKKNKRVRSDDSTGPTPLSKKPTPSSYVRTVVAEDLCVVIDNQSVPNGFLSDLQIDQIRFELSLALLKIIPGQFAPNFEFAGSSGGKWRLRCMNPESKNWLYTNINSLNCTLQGAKLRVRMASEARTHLVTGFFPVYRTVDTEFISGLLIRQNLNLDVNS